MNKVAIIGAGASGLVAAITAARLGAQVVLIERQNRIGKKILVTGNGRCNLTNTYINTQCFHTHSKVKELFPLQEINMEETLDFFEELGIVRLIEGTKVYPLSEQASSVVDVLKDEVEKLGIEVCLECKVTQITRKKDGWHLVSQGKEVCLADTVIVATGGMAAPQLGCDETGYKLLEGLGHTKGPLLPTLVHILSSSKYCKMMQGTRIKADASIYVQNKCVRKEYGEVLFTEDGLSGPPIFQLSRIAAESTANKQPCKVILDLFPAIDEDTMVAMLYDRIGKQPQRTVEGLFVGWLHKRLIVPIIKAADIGSVSASCADLDYDMILKLVRTIKTFTFEVTGTRDFKFAQATAGGISLGEIDLHTMASKVAPSLFITGEVLDVDGDCGGYNLQWAWSTGILAGRQAAK